MVEEGFDFVGDEAGWQEQVGLQGAVLHDLGNVTPDEFCEIPCGRCVEQGLANVPQHFPTTIVPALVGARFVLNQPGGFLDGT